jgi:pimeloyl-ACP methyl ester carboxylesterase
VALDPLGVGESDRPSAQPCTLELATGAIFDAVTNLRAGLSAGTVVPEIGVVSDSPMVLIGHSMGATMSLIAQARFGAFDALGLLGLNFAHTEQRLASVAAVATETGVSPGEARVRMLYGSKWQGPDTFDVMDKAPLLDFFFGVDGDPAIRKFEAEHLSVVWPARLPIDAFGTSLRDYAASINVPLFLGLGERELKDPAEAQAQVTHYPGTRDITLYVAPGAWHCHNFFNSRIQLWRRLCDWAASVTEPA